MALTQATAMTGGKSYTLKTTTPFSDKTKKVKLCLYVKNSKDTTNRKNTLTLGMYVTADWAIGKWTDYGTSSLAGVTFDGTIPNFSGTWWLVSGVTKTINYDNLGEATAKIAWSWSVNSEWGNMQYPSGTKSITLPEITPKTYTVTFNNNGGKGSPASQTKTYGTDLKLSSTKPTRSGYSFVGWNTKSNGSGTSYKAGGTYTKNAALTLYAQWATSITACGKPSSLSVTAGTDNKVTLSCKVGSNGTGNAASGVELFITCDGTAPSATNYNYKRQINEVASTVVQHTLDFSKMSRSKVAGYFGNDYTGSVKFIAKTLGSAGDSYDSGVTSAASGTLTYHGKITTPSFNQPGLRDELCGLLTPYVVNWNAGSSGVNNDLSKYRLRLFDVTSDSDVATYETTDLSYSIPASIFIADHTYRMYLTAVGTYPDFDGKEVSSGLVTFKNINKFSEVANVISVSDGNTVPSTNILGLTAYPNIGSGTICKLSWDTPIVANNEISGYDLLIEAVSSTGGAIGRCINIGLVNEYYITSDLIEYDNNVTVYIYLQAKSKYGSPYSGTIGRVTFRSIKCSGTYVKVSEGYTQPLMKRAIAFAQVSDESEDSGLLLDTNNLDLVDINDISLAVHTLMWAPMQKAYKKNAAGAWELSDIRYEALADNTGSIITDENNEIIYIL